MFPGVSTGLHPGSDGFRRFIISFPGISPGSVPDIPPPSQNLQISITETYPTSVLPQCCLGPALTLPRSSSLHFFSSSSRPHLIIPTLCHYHTLISFFPAPFPLFPISPWLRDPARHSSPQLLAALARARTDRGIRPLAAPAESSGSTQRARSTTAHLHKSVISLV